MASDTPASGATGRAVTPQERQFLEEYVANDYNATQAYLKAWPLHSYSTARVESSKLLANPYIQTELEAVKDEYARRLRISPAKVLKELALIAFSDIGEAFTPAENEGELDSARPLSKMKPSVRRAIQSAKTKKRKMKGGGDVAEEIEEVEYKLYSKLDALDKLCKKLGLFKDDDKGGPTLTEAEKIQVLKALLGGGTPEQLPEKSSDAEPTKAGDGADSA